MLSIIDKEKADIFNTINIIFGILLILVLPFGLNILSRSLLEIYTGIFGFIWMGNNILGFFSYKNERGIDYLGICIFLRIVRIISGFSFILVLNIRDDEIGIF